MKKSLRRLITLIVLATCLTSLKSYAEEIRNEVQLETQEDLESEIEAVKRIRPIQDLSLELPSERIARLNGETGVFFDLSQFKTILEIYSNYISIADENIMLNEEYYALDVEYQSCLTQVERADKVIEGLGDNSERLTNILSKEIKEQKKSNNTDVIWGTIIGAGGIVVGTALGILIGLAVQ